VEERLGIGAGERRMEGYVQTGRVGGADTWSTVLDRLVRDAEFGEVVSRHLRLDFDIIEHLFTDTQFPPSLSTKRDAHLAIVDTDDAANHLGDDDHVPQVGLDRRRLLVRRGLFLRLAELLDKSHRLALQAALEPAACTCMDELYRIMLGEGKERIKG
jgi:hypothetical protein